MMSGLSAASREKRYSRRWRYRTTARTVAPPKAYLRHRIQMVTGTGTGKSPLPSHSSTLDIISRVCRRRAAGADDVESSGAPCSFADPTGCLLRSSPGFKCASILMLAIEQHGGELMLPPRGGDFLSASSRGARVPLRHMPDGIVVGSLGKSISSPESRGKIPV